MLKLVVDNKKDNVLYYWASDFPGKATSTGRSTTSYHVKREGNIYLAGEKLSPKIFIEYFYAGTLDHLALEIEDAMRDDIHQHINEVPFRSDEEYIKGINDGGIELIRITPRKLDYHEQARLRKILNRQYPVSQS